VLVLIKFTYCRDDQLIWIGGKDVRQWRVFGAKKTLELDILQNFITCAKEINSFRILFACLST